MKTLALIESDCTLRQGLYFLINLQTYEAKNITALMIYDYKVLINQNI